MTTPKNNLPVSPEQAIAFINAGTTPGAREARKQLVQELLNGSVTTWDSKKLVVKRIKLGVGEPDVKSTIDKSEDSKPT